MFSQKAKDKPFQNIWRLGQVFFLYVVAISGKFDVKSIKSDQLFSLEYTMPRKNINLSYSIRMYWTNFWQPTVLVQQKLEKLLQKFVGHIFRLLLAPFFVQIGQLFEAQWVFEECLNIDKSLFSKENVVDFEFFRKFKDLCREWLIHLDGKVSNEA